MSRPERVTRAESRERTRRRLIDAALRLLGERGLASCSIDEICAEAGLTRGAFHYNFASREDLLAAVVASRLEEWSTRAEDALTDVSSVDGFLKVVDASGEFDDAGVALHVDEMRIKLELVLAASRTQSLRPAVAQLFATRRERGAKDTEQLAALIGKPLPAPALFLATVFRAIEDGILLQHLVDPENVPMLSAVEGGRLFIDGMLALMNLEERPTDQSRRRRSRRPNPT